MIIIEIVVDAADEWFIMTLDVKLHPQLSVERKMQPSVLHTSDI